MKTQCVGRTFLLPLRKDPDGGGGLFPRPASEARGEGGAWRRVRRFLSVNQRLLAPALSSVGDGEEGVQTRCSLVIWKAFSSAAFFSAGLFLFLTAIARCPAAEADASASPTNGWKPFPFTFEIQHPYDLKTSDRYWFDSTNNTHHFWVNFTDKPHAPPPNRTTARTEMRLQSYTNGEYMFDADVNISPGTFACIAQVFDAKHGPVRMIIAHPDGTVLLGRDLVKTNAIGHWWNLKMTNDTKTGGKIRIYADNVLIGTYDSRGPRDYYFKCGVYSRKDSDRSEASFRNIRMWVKPNQ